MGGSCLGLGSAASDGVEQLWDAGTGAAVMEWGEHEKRAWSVDFSPCDPTRLASGSDDGTVKLWSINQDTSVGTIHTKANVCSVAFPPHSSHLLALGSADYSLHCFDLRSLRAPLATLTGHSKAVSYVKFVDASTIVSASTDNTLKLWDLNQACSQQAGGGADGASACTRTFTGHTNEKRVQSAGGGGSGADGGSACRRTFTGHTNEKVGCGGVWYAVPCGILCPDSPPPLLVCATIPFCLTHLRRLKTRCASHCCSTIRHLQSISPSICAQSYTPSPPVSDPSPSPSPLLSQVFAFHKSLPMPMAAHRFGGVDPVTGADTEEDAGQFVSSVCWRGDSQTLVAANSTGNIKLLEMV
ncbi:unnamed protein product [Closterium sp. Naga37s-1]|nr:unnamed protein product [Closterium sp. Naga37s-1]